MLNLMFNLIINRIRQRMKSARVKNRRTEEKKKYLTWSKQEDSQRKDILLFEKTKTV